MKVESSSYSHKEIEIIDKLTEVNRVLKKNGIVIFFDPNVNFILESALKSVRFCFCHEDTRPQSFTKV